MPITEGIEECVKRFQNRKSQIEGDQEKYLGLEILADDSKMSLLLSRHSLNYPIHITRWDIFFL